MASLGCGEARGPEAVARRFVQSYYVETDLKGAARQADGLALERIEQSLSLIEGVEGQAIDETTRRPKIFFDLMEGKTEGEEATYLFRITVRPPEFREMSRVTSLILRKREAGWKVTQFSDHE